MCVVIFQGRRSELPLHVSQGIDIFADCNKKNSNVQFLEDNWGKGDFCQAAVNPPRAKAHSLVRMAYKAFEMSLPFDDCGIDPGSEVLYKSHKDKVEQDEGLGRQPFCKHET
jgi:hypothetical protein